MNRIEALRRIYEESKRDTYIACEAGDEKSPPSVYEFFDMAAFLMPLLLDSIEWFTETFPDWREYADHDPVAVLMDEVEE